MTEVIKILTKEIIKRCNSRNNVFGNDIWTYHIKPVYDLVSSYYQKYNANYEVVAIAALLHDIALITDVEFGPEHNIIGSSIAKELLERYNYDKKNIIQIRKCILNHRNIVLNNNLTKEEECLIDCNSMAYFYNISYLYKTIYNDHGMSVDDGMCELINKLNEYYLKMSTQGKKIVNPQYEAIKVLLKSKNTN